jgi:hypothetical protein
MAVTVEQVAVELARPTPTSPVSDQWQSWIDRAYRLIENRLGAASYAALDPEILDDVVLMAVVEHVRGWRESTASQYTVSVDDGTVSRKFERATGLLEIPDDLWPLLGVEVVAESFTIEP